MPTYNVLTWNIWQTGYKDYGAESRSYPRYVNAENFLNYTAKVIVSKNANIVALQEIYAQAGEAVLFSLCEALRILSNRDWYYLPPIIAAENGNAECYGFLWRNGDGFVPVTQGDPLVDGYSTTNAVCGLAINEFPDNSGTLKVNGSRRASYAVFISTAGQYSIVTNYHAPSKINGATEGLTAVANMIELYGYDGRQYSAIFLCGDYNVNMIDLYNQYNDRLMSKTDTVQSVFNNTSLCTNNAEISATQPDDSTSYRSSAYDNIFFSKSLAGPNAGDVVDLIAENNRDGLQAFSNAYLLQQPGTGRYTFQYANVIPASNSPTYRSFILTRYAISDHLPVFVSINAP